MKLIVHVDDLSGFLDKPDSDRIVEVDYEDPAQISITELARNRCYKIGRNGLFLGNEYIPPHKINKIYIEYTD